MAAKQYPFSSDHKCEVGGTKVAQTGEISGLPLDGFERELTGAAASQMGSFGQHKTRAISGYYCCSQRQPG